MSRADIIGAIKRWPYCAACALLTVALVAGAWYLRGEIAALEVTHRERTQEGETMLALLVGGSTQRQELAAAREYSRRIEENLLQANLAENLWYFYKLEEQTKSRLPELHQLSSPTTDKSPLFRRVPYTLRVTGAYDQVMAFLLALETGPRLVKISTFQFSRGDAMGNLVTLNLAIELLGKK